jgi:hypothetical protein
LHFLMSDRIFTLAEAQSLLPVLESLLRTAMDAKQTIEQVEAEQQLLTNRIFLHGGVKVDVVNVARRKSQAEQATQRAKDAIAEIHATGVQVKDLDIGLLDFPCRLGGSTVLLCWKMGEKAILHYHATDEGFSGRKPLDQRLLGEGRTDDPERPN